METKQITFTSSEVCAITNLTLRQLQWWDEQNVVSPQIAKHARQYEIQEVVLLAVLSGFRAKQVPLQRLRSVMRRMDRELAKRLPEIMEGQALYIALAGTELEISSSDKKLFEVMAKSQNRRGWHMISIQDQLRGVKLQKEAA